MAESIWLYSVYRNKDDRLMVLDVPAAKAMEILGLKRPQSFYHFMSISGGKGRFYTVIKKSRKEVEEDVEEGAIKTEIKTKRAESMVCKRTISG